MEYISVERFEGKTVFINNYPCKTHKFAKKLLNKTVNQYRKQGKYVSYEFNHSNMVNFITEIVTVHNPKTGNFVQIIHRNSEDILPESEVDDSLPF